MSRHSRLIQKSDKFNIEVVVGFDRPTNSTFFQIFNAADAEEELYADEQTHGTLKAALDGLGLSEDEQMQYINPMVRETIAELVAAKLSVPTNTNLVRAYEPVVLSD